MEFNIADSQQVLGFVTPQYYNIEANIYEIKYKELDYASLVPVVTEGNEWSRGTLFYSMDMAGRADWINGNAKDIPFADVSRAQFSRGFHMAGIGYQWNVEEISVARMEGISLPDSKARAARRASEEMLYETCMTGSTEKGWTGLLNDPNVAAADVEGNGTGDSTFWADKTPDQILRDVNAGLTGIGTTTQRTAMADTVLFPFEILDYLATTPRSSTSDTNILNYLRANNVYTATTNQPLTIRGLIDLNTADPGGDGRIVMYRRNPEVLRFHLPMPHRFLPPFQSSPMTYDVPGIMRTGGLEVRLPSEMRYLDGVWASA